MKLTSKQIKKMVENLNKKFTKETGSALNENNFLVGIQSFLDCPKSKYSVLGEECYYNDAKETYAVIYEWLLEGVLKDRMSEYNYNKNPLTLDEIMHYNDSLNDVMQVVWNSLVDKSEVNPKYNVAPAYGGLTKKNYDELVTKTYFSNYDEQVANHDAHNTKAVVREAKRNLAFFKENKILFELNYNEYVTNRPAFKGQPDSFSRTFAKHYTTLKNNFASRNIISKLFHLDEYFTCQNILKSFAEIVPTKLSYREADHLLEKATAKVESDRSKDLKDVLDQLPKAIEAKVSSLEKASTNDMTFRTNFDEKEILDMLNDEDMAVEDGVLNRDNNVDLIKTFNLQVEL